MKVLGVVLAVVGLVGWSQPLRVVLDFYPNPNHVPLYVAQELGFFGVEVELVVPSDPSAPAKLVASGAAQLGLTPQINYFLARDMGLPLLAIGALIDGALGGLLSLEERGVRTLADLRGKSIGYSLEPLEPVLWATMLGAAGLGPGDYRLVYIGMSTLPALLSGQVAAIGAFRNYEPLAVEQEGFHPVFFPQEDYGVPNTYELLVVTHPKLLALRAQELRLFLQGLARGIAWTLENPEEAFLLFVRVFPEYDDELNRRSLAVTLPLYARGARHDDRLRWVAMQTFLAGTGMISRTWGEEDLYTLDLLPQSR